MHSQNSICCQIQFAVSCKTKVKFSKIYQNFLIAFCAEAERERGEGGGQTSRSQSVYSSHTYTHTHIWLPAVRSAPCQSLTAMHTRFELSLPRLVFIPSVCVSVCVSLSLVIDFNFINALTSVSSAHTPPLLPHEVLTV